MYFLSIMTKTKMHSISYFECSDEVVSTPGKSVVFSCSYKKNHSLSILVILPAVIIAESS